MLNYSASSLSNLSRGSLLPNNGPCNFEIKYNSSVHRLLYLNIELDKPAGSKPFYF